jgi:hypothetical protein
VTPINDDTAVLSALPIGPAPEEVEDDRGDDLADELAHAAPKRWWNKGTVVLAAVVLLVGGFVGGLQAQKNWGTTATTAGNGGNQNRAGYGGTGRAGYGNFGGGLFPGGAAQGGAAQGGVAPGGTGTAAAAAAATTGTVKLVDGSTIYVQTADGNVVTIKTDGKTTVSAASKSTVKSVKAGQSITVEGSTASDGTVTATSVTTRK